MHRRPFEGRHLVLVIVRAAFSPIVRVAWILLWFWHACCSVWCELCLSALQVATSPESAIAHCTTHCQCWLCLSSLEEGRACQWLSDGHYILCPPFAWQWPLVNKLTFGLNTPANTSSCYISQMSGTVPYLATYFLFVNHSHFFFYNFPCRLCY